MKRQRIIYTVVIGITSCIVFMLVFIAVRPTPAEKICRNLINAGYFNDESACVLTEYPPDYIGAMFPLNEVDINFVRLGMKDFKVTSEKEFATGSTITYRLQDKILIQLEFYVFEFDESGILVDTEWQN